MRLRALPVAIRLLSLAILVIFVSVSSSCGKIRKMVGIGDFGVNIRDAELMAHVVLTKIPTDTGMTIEIPQLPSGFLEVGPAPKSGTMIRLRAPVASILEAIADGTLVKRGLPDGRPLYGTTTGFLPSFDVTTQVNTLRFYVSHEVFGFFVPVRLPNFGSPVELPIKDDRGYVVAYGVAIPPASNRGSGLLVLVPIVMLKNAL